MTNTIRPDLEALPSRMSSLPINDDGYPVPWFVAWVDGKPEFRAADAEKLRSAIRHRRCWVCGEPLGNFLTFVAGPMGGVNRTSAEPPAHLECGQWSARNCPFLSNAKRKRREDEVMNNENLQANAAGFAITRNPGVTLLWTTRSYELFGDGRGGVLFHMGPPTSIQYWREGRKATREEVRASVQSGLSPLQAMATEQGDEAVVELAKALETFDGLVAVYANE
jgi:hypothetical protein